MRGGANKICYAQTKTPFSRICWRTVGPYIYKGPGGFVDKERHSPNPQMTDEVEQPGEEV